MDALSEMDRRVTYVENETLHIYDLIEERAAEVRQRFNEVDQKFAEIDRRFDEIGTTLTEHTDALAEILRRLPPAS